MYVLIEWDHEDESLPKGINAVRTRMSRDLLEREAQQDQAEDEASDRPIRGYQILGPL